MAAQRTVVIYALGVWYKFKMKQVHLIFVKAGNG